jgi:hypothetical protein
MMEQRNVIKWMRDWVSLRLITVDLSLSISFCRTYHQNGTLAHNVHFCTKVPQNYTFVTRTPRPQSPTFKYIKGPFLSKHHVYGVLPMDLCHKRPNKSKPWSFTTNPDFWPQKIILGQSFDPPFVQKDPQNSFTTENEIDPKTPGTWYRGSKSDFDPSDHLLSKGTLIKIDFDHQTHSKVVKMSSKSWFWCSNSPKSDFWTQTIPFTKTLADLSKTPQGTYYYNNKDSYTIDTIYSYSKSFEYRQRPCPKIKQVTLNGQNAWTRLYLYNGVIYILPCKMIIYLRC